MGNLEKHPNHILIKKNKIRIHDNADSDVCVLSIDNYATEVTEEDLNDILECILRRNKARYDGE